MPIPKPNSNETREEFINRCMNVIISEGTDQEQAVVICTNQWDSKKAMDNIISKKNKSLVNNYIILK